MGLRYLSVVENTRIGTIHVRSSSDTVRYLLSRLANRPRRHPGENDIYRIITIHLRHDRRLISRLLTIDLIATTIILINLHRFRFILRAFNSLFTGHRLLHQQRNFRLIFNGTRLLRGTITRALFQNLTRMILRINRNHTINKLTLIFFQRQNLRHRTNFNRNFVRIIISNTHHTSLLNHKHRPKKLHINTILLSLHSNILHILSRATMRHAHNNHNQIRIHTLNLLGSQDFLNASRRSR